MLSEKQKTLEQILKEKYEQYILSYSWDLTDKQLKHISKVVIEGFKEWLQQKRKKLIKEWRGGQPLCDEVYNELLEELEKEKQPTRFIPENERNRKLIDIKEFEES